MVTALSRPAILRVDTSEQAQQAADGIVAPARPCGMERDWCPRAQPR